MQVLWKNLSSSPNLKIKKIVFHNLFSFMWEPGRELSQDLKTTQQWKYLVELHESGIEVIWSMMTHILGYVE
jgi:hypothetical protein